MVQIHMVYALSHIDNKNLLPNFHWKTECKTGDSRLQVERIAEIRTKELHQG
jgi:hypothetical protein